MIHLFRLAALVAIMTGAAAAYAPAAPAPAGQQTPQAPEPTAQQPPPPVATPTPDPAGQTPSPSAAAPATPAPAAAAGCPAPVPPATPPARAFGSQTGLLLHPVQSARVADFELFLRYLRDALAKTTDATVRSQASGWKFFRVTEPGPNGDVIYAFLLDPAVPCVDYALAPILADAYPDPAQMQEIWKLYTGSVRSGGTIMNLVPLPATPPPPVTTPSTTATSPATGAGQAPDPSGAGLVADPTAKPAPMPPAPPPTGRP